MICSKCGKNKAEVFFDASSSDKENSQNKADTNNKSDKKIRIGLCYDCLDALCPPEENFTPHNLAEMIPPDSEVQEFIVGGDENGNSFISGGPATLPPFIQGLFASMPFLGKRSENNSETPKPSNSEKKAETKSKVRKHVRRKYTDLYCTNLTQKARNGELDNIVGRERELMRTVQILSRRGKNNPCLVGEPGVGKTAIAEGLALNIVSGRIPFNLRKKEILLLDMTALVAGTQFRGQFENRIKGLIEEIKRDGNIILFIDEVHTLVGAGDSHDGPMTAANIMKPALSRGEVQVIGATTYAEYRKHIEKDAALERRFQKINVEEPNISQTIQILKGIKSSYEEFHKVNVSEEILQKIVVLSERYITERFLPDKAIDLLDESCACASLRNKLFIKYEILQENIKKLTAQEEALVSISTQKSENNDNNENYEQLAKIRCDKAKYLEELQKIPKEKIYGTVTEFDVAHVIELWTGISSVKICEDDFKKLRNLENELSKKIIGQKKAIHEIASAIKRNKIQINPRRRPASFIFVGPTGVGKTELVKVLAEKLFNQPDALIRVDMSEYMEKHTVSKIIGTPPGYIGYDDAGQLTEKVRQKPYSVVLFDEIEKAHPDVMNVLLQILDEGKINDSLGKTVDFQNAIIVMTSNAGSNKKGDGIGFGKTTDDLTHEKAMKALSEFLRPEFLSRVDEIVVFNNLTLENYVEISQLVLDEYKPILLERKIKFEYDKKAAKKLAKMSFGDKSGARKIRNLARKNVEDKIADIIVENSDNVGGFDLFLDENLNLKVLR